MDLAIVVTCRMSLRITLRFFGYFSGHPNVIETFFLRSAIFMTDDGMMAYLYLPKLDM